MSEPASYETTLDPKVTSSTAHANFEIRTKAAPTENGSILDLRPEVLDKAHVDAVEAKLKASQRGTDKKVVLDLRDVSSGDMSEGVRLGLCSCCVCPAHLPTSDLFATAIYRMGYCEHRVQ